MLDWIDYWNPTRIDKILMNIEGGDERSTPLNQAWFYSLSCRSIWAFAYGLHNQKLFARLGPFKSCVFPGSNQTQGELSFDDVPEIVDTVWKFHDIDFGECTREERIVGEHRHNPERVSIFVQMRWYDISEYDKVELVSKLGGRV